jgi:hypothetical protein
MTKETTSHFATDPKKCEEMADKYNWKLQRYKDTGSGNLPVECIFEGDAEFPKSRMDYIESEQEDVE